MGIRIQLQKLGEQCVEVERPVDNAKRNNNRPLRVLRRLGRV